MTGQCGTAHYHRFIVQAQQHKTAATAFVTVAAICICYIEVLSVMSASRTSSGTVFHSPFL